MDSAGKAVLGWVHCDGLFSVGMAQLPRDAVNRGWRQTGKKYVAGVTVTHGSVGSSSSP